MDDTARFAIVAEAASMVSRLNPGVHDEIVGRVVGNAMAEMNDAGVELTAAELALQADQALEMLVISAETIRILKFQKDDDVEIELDTAIASLGFGNEDIEVLREGLAARFDISQDDIDFSTAETVGALVDQIVQAEVEDEAEEDVCPCGNPSCGGNTPAYKQRQDADIARLGVTLAPVLPGNDGPGFVYSLGMSEQGKTDLLFVGDFTPPTYDYLSMFLSMQIDGEDLPFGLFPADHPRNGFGVPIWIIPADEKLGTHAFGAVSRLQRIGSEAEARLAQVVMPDKSGRFPWEPGYDWIDQQVEKPMGVGTA